MRGTRDRAAVRPRAITDVLDLGAGGVEMRRSQIPSEVQWLCR